MKTILRWTLAVIVILLLPLLLAVAGLLAGLLLQVKIVWFAWFIRHGGNENGSDRKGTDKG